MVYLKQVIILMLGIGLNIPLGATESIARVWNEHLLDAIRLDYPAPTVHSRNLFHVSAAMYDAWCAYGTGPELAYLIEEEHTAENVAAARNEAISYAAFRILMARYIHSPGAANTLAALEARMLDLGYNPSIETVEGNSPIPRFPLGKCMAIFITGQVTQTGPRNSLA